MLKAYSVDKYLLRELIKLGEGVVRSDTLTLSANLHTHRLTINRALLRLEKNGYLERCGRDLWRVLKDENSD